MINRLVLAVSALALAALAVGPGAVAQEATLVAARVQGSSGPMDDLHARYWQRARAVNVPMQPQIMVVPQKPNAAVSQLSVKTVHNGQWIAFLIEWSDPTKSDQIVIDRFGDQVAVELPVKYAKDSLPNVTMGNPDGRVTIMQWRAAFQRDLDEGEPGIKTLYPFAHVDIYPDEVLKASDARAYMGSLGVDNPIAHPRHVPVLDQMAEGWGSLTVKPEQTAVGKGAWKDGRWRVVITRPLSTDNNEHDPRLAPGSETVAAFAVWEGGNGEVGSRKAWSDWIKLTIGK